MSISGEDAVKSPSENTATAGDESFLIVVVALGANLLIAVAKTVAAVVTGSASVSYTHLTLPTILLV